MKFFKKRRKQYTTHRTLKSIRAQKIRQRPRRDLVQRTSKSFKKRIQSIVIATVTILLLVGCIVGRNLFFYGSSQRIQEIQFGSGTLVGYDDPELLSDVQELLVGNYRRASTWFGISDEIALIQQTHPQIQTINLENFQDGIAMTEIIRHTPSIVYRLPGDRWYASYDEYLFAVDPDDQIINQSRVVDLPRYTETFDTLEGIYRQISQSELEEILTSIDTALGRENISERIYLPGGRKLFLGHDSRRWYFHLNKDIIIQLEKLMAIKNNYTEYEAISVIDLGSTDNVIVQ